MRALAFSLRRRPTLPDALAAGAAAGYLYIWFLAVSGQRIPISPFIIFAPLVIGPIALFKRIPVSPLQSVALGLMTFPPLALVWTLVIGTSPLTALAFPLMALSAIVVSRYPAASVGVLFVLAGAYGSLKAFAHIPAQKSVDVVMGGLWLGAAWRWVVRPRVREGVAIWPGVACIWLYGVFTAFEILTAEDVTVGLQSFRQSAWYLGAALLIAYGPWPQASRDRIQKVVVGLALVIGAYCTFRWIVGPSAGERAIAVAGPNNFLDGKLRPIGSFFGTKELAAWSAFAIPFTAGMALALRGRWRVVAALACVACVMSMFAADVRAAPAAAVPGTITVFLLYQLSQGFRGRRGAATAIAIVGSVLVGGAAFTLTLGDKQDSGRRYRAILDPTSDSSYKARVIKWHTAWQDIEHAPLGHGLGTSGYAQKRYGQTQNINSIDVDNSYLKVAYEQGFIVMVFYAFAVILLLIGLARRAITTTDPARAGPAIAASGTLVAMLVLFFVGTYIEGLPVLAAWMMVGVGLSQFSHLTPEERDRPEFLPEPVLARG